MEPDRNGQQVREVVGIFAGREAIGEPERRHAQQRGRQHPKHDGRIKRLGQRALVDAGLDLGDQLFLDLARNGEALVFPADPRNRAIDEHQREMLRVLERGVPGMPRTLHELILAEFRSVAAAR